MVDKYTWVDIGSSYLPSEMIAAFLYAQLEESDKITEKRLAIWNEYHRLLEPLEKSGRLRRPVIPADCGHNAHMYYILLKDLDTRTKLIEYLKKQDISPVFHYVPLHSAPKGIELCGKKYNLPITEEYAERLLRLPCYYELPIEQIGVIVKHIQTFLCAAGQTK